MSQIVIGTAGHIDHGKTSLVKALTGTDTDQLNEEKQRGMTIDLGFAYLNENFTIIDVPGHEKFIRNMTAGAANIHFGLIVIAADDGIMPQTIEHIDILNILGVRKVWVAITKIDIVNDEEWIDLIELEIREYLSNYKFEIFSLNRINNLTGEGVNSLKKKILSSSCQKKSNNFGKFFRMNVDRFFTKKGFGTIVTGTVIQGIAKVGDSVQISPSDIITKIRGIQSHGGDVQRINKGDRAALNLQNVKLNNLHRGSVILSPKIIKKTNRIIARISIVDSTEWILKNGQRVRLHFGTGEIMARSIIKNQKKISKGNVGNIILNLESNISVALGDRFVIRSYSPMDTIGGGIVLDPYPNQHYANKNVIIDAIPLDPKERFYFLVNSLWEKSKNVKEWKKIFINYNNIEEWCDELGVKKTKNNVLYTSEIIEKAKIKLKTYFKNFHSKNYLKNTVSFETINSFVNWCPDFLEIVLNALIIEKSVKKLKGGYCLSSYSAISLTKTQAKQIKAVEGFIKKSGLFPVHFSDIQKFLNYNSQDLQDFIYLLNNEKKIAGIGNDFFFHRNHLRTILNDLKKYFGESREINVSEFKKLTGLTRKTAIPLLEFLDKNNYTIRKNNFRIIGQELHE